MRRLVVAALVLPLLGCSGPDQDPPSWPATVSASPTAGACVPDQDAMVAELERLEAARNARVGVHAVDTGTGAELAHRADERFAFASTVKALAAAVALDRLSEQQLSRRLSWTEADLVPYSPVTELRVAEGLTVRQVLEAAVTVSDNTAANLVLDLVGGPRGLDRALEAVGDDTTEVVRREPGLNDYSPGDVRDTTTPRALATSLAAFAVGGGLGTSDERLLNDLLVRNTTGDDLVRAVVPRGWRVGDKTGTATHGTRNDVAVVTPPGRAPIVLAVMTRHDAPDAPTDDVLVARAARVVLDSLCGQRQRVPRSR